MQVSLPWTVKYRPQRIEDTALKPEYKEKIKQYLEDPTTMPCSILLVGPVGTGKTTIAKMLAARAAKTIYIKGSVESSVNVVKERIEPFCKTLPTQRKVVRIEEADRLSHAAQLALRNIIEEYDAYPNVTFVMTANHIWRIHDALRSRSVIFEFDNVPPEEIKARLKYILQKENVQFNGSEEELDKLLDEIIYKHYPMIRDMINALEGAVINGVLNPQLVKRSSESTQKLIDLARDIINGQTIDFQTFRDLMNTFSQNIDYYKVFEEIAKYSAEVGNVKALVWANEKLRELDTAYSPDLLYFEYLMRVMKYARA